jgi:hypothetical protein
MFILAGLELFDTEQIKAEFEMQDIETKLIADSVIRDIHLNESTLITLPHKEFLRLVRQNV